MDMQTGDDGVSEVVGFILILALIVIVVAVWGVYASSAEGSAKESENSIHILEQMSDLKYGMDLLWEANTTGVQRSMMFSLYPDMKSDAFLPVMDMYPGSGTLRVVPSDLHLTIENDSNRLDVDDIRMLEYVTSYNYAENIVMSLDLGAVTSQTVQSGVSNSVLLPPVGNGTSGPGPLVVLPVLSVSGPESISGNGIVALDYNLTHLDRRPFVSGANITIEADDTSLAAVQWKQMLDVSGFQVDPSNESIYRYSGGRGNITIARYEVTMRAVV